ncbi:MAG: hypothetical protein QM760_08975 [Nibricoccus sp.]
MIDRATYLARRLLARLTEIENAAERAVSDAEGMTLRREVVTKILAVEEWITDGPTVALVVAAVPFIPRSSTPSNRDVESFAAFLRERLRVS